LASDLVVSQPRILDHSRGLILFLADYFWCVGCIQRANTWPGTGAHQQIRNSCQKCAKVAYNLSAFGLFLDPNSSQSIVISSWIITIVAILNDQASSSYWAIPIKIWPSVIVWRLVKTVLHVSAIISRIKEHVFKYQEKIKENPYRE
jgi:hypothetical protein